MHPGIPAAMMAFVFSVNPLLAGQLVEVDLDPITHIEATLVVVGQDGAEVSYTPAELEAFATFSLTTTTPWRDDAAEFTGVLLTDILAASDLAATDAIVVTAENDFTTVLERALWESVDILVATRVNGRAHTRRERGPIQFVIDADAFNASDLTSDANLVWMAARIEVQG